jgi:hypothetical protein
LGLGVPKPLLGSSVDENGNVQFGIVETAEMNSDGTVETGVTVSFVVPIAPSSKAPTMPLVSLASTIGSGGSLQGGQTLYYGVSGENNAGNEGILSFLVVAVITNNGSSATLSDLSFAPGTSKFHVYRGNTPAELYRIASDLPLATQFTDTGLPIQLIAPPDANFDHSNFYWRLEQQGECAATLHSPTTVGNGTLSMAANGY